MLPDNDYQILRLTDKFYDTYPNPPYTEILTKGSRAYNCLLFQTHYDYFICIPYRSEVNHNSAYHFKKSIRSRIHKSGLDYTKMIIITNSEYIDNVGAIIDKDEFKETIKNFEKIKREALEYVEEYIMHEKGIQKLHPAKYKRKYLYSTLQYFHKELGIQTKL